ALVAVARRVALEVLQATLVLVVGESLLILHCLTPCGDEALVLCLRPVFAGSRSRLRDLSWTLSDGGVAPRSFGGRAIRPAIREPAEFEARGRLRYAVDRGSAQRRTFERIAGLTRRAGARDPLAVFIEGETTSRRTRRGFLRRVEVLVVGQRALSG